MGLVIRDEGAPPCSTPQAGQHETGNTQDIGVEPGARPWAQPVRHKRDAGERNHRTRHASQHHEARERQEPPARRPARLTFQDSGAILVGRSLTPMKMHALEKLIQVDPEICHGKPCFAGTRILVSDILELLGAGISPTAITSKYFPRLRQAHIHAALQYAAEQLNNREFVAFSKS